MYQMSEVIMNTANDLYQFTKKYGINYNTNEEKGIRLFQEFLQAFPKTNFTFSFIGFHKYESIKKNRLCLSDGRTCKHSKLL